MLYFGPCCLRAYNLYRQYEVVSFCWITNNPPTFRGFQHQTFISHSCYRRAAVQAGWLQVCFTCLLTLGPRMEKQPHASCCSLAEEHQWPSQSTQLHLKLLLWSGLSHVCSHSTSYSKPQGWVCQYTPPPGREQRVVTKTKHTTDKCVDIWTSRRPVPCKSRHLVADD